MSDETSAVRVWDLPTRAFHWVLAACVLASLSSAWIGGNAMVWHLRFGYVVFALLLFRLLWGFVGGHWSRFATFAYSPGHEPALPARRRAGPTSTTTSATTRSARSRCSACC